MPPPVILDPTALDFSQLFAGPEEIARANPQRFEFALLDGIVCCDAQKGICVGYHDIRPDAWWVRAHVPGRPLFPGVLMIEVAAQLSCFVTFHVMKDSRFIGFAGVDEVKFRGTVEPPCRFVVAIQALEIKRRRTHCYAQGFVGGTMVFEGKITGMPL